MQSAGRYQNKQPDRYNPSSYYQSPMLSTETTTPSLTSLQRQIDDMKKVFHQQLDSFASRFTEYDEKFYDLCIRIDEVDTDLTFKLTQVQTNFHADFVAIQGNITESIASNNNSHSTNLNESINHMNSVQRSLNAWIQSLSDRISVTGGQASRLVAIENKIQNISINPVPPDSNFSISTPPSNKFFTTSKINSTTSWFKRSFFNHSTLHFQIK